MKGRAVVLGATKLASYDEIKGLAPKLLGKREREIG